MSEKSEKIFDGVTQVGDDLVEMAQERPKRRLYRKWMGPVAAVLALALLVNALLGGDMVSALYAVERAEYPKSRAMNMNTIGFGDGANRFIAASVPVFLGGADGANRVYSPLSAYMALAMTAELTDSESRAQILNALGEEDMETLRERAKLIWNRNYRNDEVGKSVLATSLWMNEDIRYERDALKTLANSYYASSFSGRMGSWGFDKALQSWLNGQTHGMLAGKTAKESTSSGTELNVLTLVSTVYFRGKWSHKFDKSATASGTFYAADGDLDCDFMSQRISGEYYWFEHFAVVPQYFTNNAAMWYILPDEGVAPEELLNDPELLLFLTSDSYEFKDNRKYLYVNLTVPKFDISAETELSEGFRTLGVTDIFDYTISDFTPLTRDPSVEERGVWLSEAKQAARVLVDEDGCEATTYIKFNFGAGAGAPPTDEIDFTLDRPFLFAVTNAGTPGLPLFVGVVNQP